MQTLPRKLRFAVRRAEAEPDIVFVFRVPNLILVIRTRLRSVRTNNIRLRRICMISFENVTKIYKSGAKEALKDVSFDINSGEFVFLVGSTGAGKTTVARLILKSETASRGRVIVDGSDVAKLKGKGLALMRRKIGTVFQDYKLLPYKTVFENVAFALEVTETPRRNINHMVPQILSLVGLEDKADALPCKLSGGEQQRTALARAMANNPPILLADEPTGNLDPDTSEEIMRLLERFNKLGTTVVVATHAKDIVDKMRRRVIELVGGVVVRDEENALYSKKRGGAQGGQ